ncbi:hypothetical protein [Streptomyces sp. CAI 127]|uniref:hypothetical protein n=1 Tax=Streptomyces sp. CAI 127 TaxID=1076397 RepID=UPI0020CA30EF|nr:hypothetical protein [Streptomyces sp. CAI 127]
MTISYLPAPADPPYEPWEGEAEALAAAADAGRRAAVWVRSLPGPLAPAPYSAWLGKVPGAIEAVMGGLDPEDCDRRVDDEFVHGTGGVDASMMQILHAVPSMLPELTWLTLDQQVRLLAVASAVTGAVQLIAYDPGTAILDGLLARQCSVITHAARTD